MVESSPGDEDVPFSVAMFMGVVRVSTVVENVVVCHVSVSTVLDAKVLFSVIEDSELEDDIWSAVDGNEVDASKASSVLTAEKTKKRGIPSFICLY